VVAAIALIDGRQRRGDNRRDDEARGAMGQRRDDEGRQQLVVARQRTGQRHVLVVGEQHHADEQEHHELGEERETR
jgi:hypothetical protein